MAGNGRTGSDTSMISDLTRVRFTNLDKIMYPLVSDYQKRSHHVLYPLGTPHASFFVRPGAYHAPFPRGDR